MKVLRQRFFVPLDMSQVFFCYRNNKIFLKSLYVVRVSENLLRQYEAVEYICFFFVHRYLMKIDNLRENNFPVLVESSST